MDGLSFLRQLREQNIAPSLPIFVVSGFMEDHLIAEARSYGVKEYLGKAKFSLGDLYRLIAWHLADT